MSKTNHTFIEGDSRLLDHHVRTIQEKVQLIVTSPPYFNIKNYGGDMQIGFNETYDEYLDSLFEVWNGCHSLLEDSCRLCINIGDQYLSRQEYGRYRVLPIQANIITQCLEIGFDYMGAIIWQKISNSSGIGGYPYPKNGMINLDYEHILIFKKQGDLKPPSKEIKEASILSKKEWMEYFTGHWRIPGEKQKLHPAPFPKEIPFRLIKMFSFIGETILDPFSGSGTTSLAAGELGRNSIGIELNKKNITISKNRLKLEKFLFNEYTIKSR